MDPVAELVARARTECPDVELDDADLAAHVRSLAGRLGDTPLDKLHAGDLRLAAACLRDRPGAHAAFEARFAGELRTAIRRVDGSATFVDEILQQLRDQMFVGASPRLASYAATGPLGAWLRVSAIRLALASRRGQRPEVPVEDELAGAAASGRTPEQELAYREHAAAFRDALRDAVAAQPKRTRVLMRYYYCDRVGVEELGRIYRVHASTVSRWLEQARTAILEDTRARLAERLAQSSGEIEQLLGLSISLDVSLGELFRSQ